MIGSEPPRPGTLAAPGALRRSSRSARALLAHARTDSLVRNSLYIMATTVVTSLLGYVFWVVAARRDPAAAVGLAAAVVSAMQLASVLSELGVRTALIQLLPKRTDPRAWSLMLTTSMVTGTVTGAVAGVMAVIGLPALGAAFSPLREPLFALLLIVGVITTTVSGVLDYAAIASRSAREMFVRNVAASMVKIALLALPFFVHRSEEGILGSWVAATAVSTVLALVLVRRMYPQFRVRFRGYRSELREVYRSMAAHHAINLGNLGPLFLLPVMVAARVSTSQTAYFYTTWRMSLVFAMISPAVASSMFAEGASSPHELRRLVRSSLRLIAMLLVPAVTAFLLVGRPVLAAVGPAYAHFGWPLMLLLMAAAVPDAITNVYSSLLRVQGRLRFAAAMNVTMATTCLVVSWVLLPGMGIAGAGVGWLVAQVGGTICIAVMVLRGRRGHGRSGT